MDNSLPRVAVRAILAGLLLTAATALTIAPPARAGSPPAGFIRAELVAPTTTYTALVTDPDGDPLTYDWSAQISCGTFNDLGDTDHATWDHPNGEGDGFCNHSDGSSHEGVVQVRINDGTGWEIFCSYTGSEAGDGSACVTVASPSPSVSQTSVFPTPCEATVTGAFFEPVQGPFQDDPFFEDRPGKQISRVHDALLQAELPLVKDRQSVLYGVERIVNGPSPNKRHQILFRGVTFGTVTTPVRAKMTATDPRGFEFEIGRLRTDDRVPLYGPCSTTPREWKARFSIARTGWPADRTFDFTNAGTYTITGELIDEFESPTGLKGSVTGQVVETTAPVVHIFPMALTTLDDGDRRLLLREAKEISVDAPLFIPDMFPLAADDFRAPLHSLLDVRVVFRRQAEELQDFLEADGLGFDGRGAFAATVGRALSAIGILGNSERIAVITNRAGFVKMYGREQSEGVVGVTPSSKVFFVRYPGGRWDTVAHELAHSVPRYIWSVNQMLSECGHNYHNTTTGIAHGLRILAAGVPNRKRYDGGDSLMGGGDGEWIDQCTYRHLVETFQSPVDPPVMLVQGVVAKNATTQAGVLYPGYTMDGITDLEASTKGSWFIVVRNAAGTETARYPFQPAFNLKTHSGKIRQKAFGFAYRIPQPAAGDTVELVGPSGMLDSVVMSAAVPVVSITSPLEGATLSQGGSVTVTWAASDADGDALTFSVLYSKDGGETFEPRAFAATGNELVVKLSKRDNHVVKVVASDGANSAEATVSFSTP